MIIQVQKRRRIRIFDSGSDLKHTPAHGLFSMYITKGLQGVDRVGCITIHDTTHWINKL